MKEIGYKLALDEKVILKAVSVKNGMWGMYGDELVLTNQKIIHIKKDILGNMKRVNQYKLDDISQAIIAKSQNGIKQLQIYHMGKMIDFEFQSDNDRELRIWVMAISDQSKEDREYYDFKSYQKFYDSNLSIRQQVVDDVIDIDEVSVGKQFTKDVVTSMLKSGNISKKGLMKGIKKASSKQMKSTKHDWVENLKNEIGFREVENEFLGIKDEFEEIGNEFREIFGLPIKKTKKQIIEEKLDEEFNLKVKAAKENTPHMKKVKSKTADKESVGEQVRILKELKELVESGILTQEEFDIKKKEVLGL